MPDKNCKNIFLIKNPGFNGFLKIIGAQNQLPITFCSDLMINRALKAKNSSAKHTNNKKIYENNLYIDIQTLPTYVHYVIWIYLLTNIRLLLSFLIPIYFHIFLLNNFPDFSSNF
jgi:hypothetical protein